MNGNQGQNAAPASEPQPEKKPENVVEISDVKEQPASPQVPAESIGGTRQATAVEIAEALDRAAARPSDEEIAEFKTFVGLDAIETRLTALETRIKELESELQHHGIL